MNYMGQGGSAASRARGAAAARSGSPATVFQSGCATVRASSGILRRSLGRRGTAPLERDSRFEPEDAFAPVPPRGPGARASRLDADDGLLQKYQVRALPTTVLIDAGGRIARFTQGYWPGETQALEAAIRELIAGTRPDSAAAPPDTAFRGR